MMEHYRAWKFARWFGWTPEEYEAADGATCDWFEEFEVHLRG